ncbi:MAG: hypothetical protein MNSN_09870 [Minisyncoccus archaeiphilus]|uniref:prepilin-type N-terminal cleavage/methylation domain-containing protein n=1 Tax=Minisyncoccus archaeiphilus TaxID=3238481 RepID=UPI002B1ACFBB|nr:MAG: hypothetical protein MNSN_09870 [Candidatus Parcubacteria bacterium]
MKLKAFTLIELLVIIAIIGILAGFIIVSMSGASDSANDARRKADINQLAKAVMIYKTNHDTLPMEICLIDSDCSDDAVFGNASLLKDPNGSYYTYSSTDGNYFTITSTLSNDNQYYFDSSTGKYIEGVASPIIPIDGVCGASADIEHDVIPVSGLCTTGNASIVSGDGVPYTWTCSGIDGGDDVSCSATKTGWVDTGLGFYIMKYEAKIQGNNNGNQTYSSSFVPESRAAGTPWVNINQNQAIAECASLGSGYHLITNAEWTSLARHIAAQPSNWSTGTVGSGVLSRGYSASTAYASDGFMNTAPAPTTGALSDVFNTGVNTLGLSGIFDLKRIYNLGNEKVVWDLAGNVWEWNSNICTQGSGTGNWYVSTWVEWNNANLSDYELLVAGPAPLLTSGSNVGMYYGCTHNNTSGLIRGGNWRAGLYGGIFSTNFNPYTTDALDHIGFRCVKS